MVRPAPSAGHQELEMGQRTDRCRRSSSLRRQRPRRWPIRSQRRCRYRSLSHRGESNLSDCKRVQEFRTGAPADRLSLIVGDREHQPAANQVEPELLYHYTTQDGLLGIIEKQEFWATDVRFLNDKEEFEAGIKTAIAMSKQASSTSGEDGRKTVDYFENILRFSFSERPVYSVSLTGSLKEYETLPDSIDDPGDRLNMWRGYSGRGIAYSIGLPRKGFSVNIDGVDLQECSYRQDTKEEYLTEAINSFGDLLNECNRNGNDKIGRGIPYEQAMNEMRRELDEGVSKILPDL